MSGKAAVERPSNTSEFRKSINRIVKNRYLLLLLLPGVLWYIIFCYVPMYGIVIGFKDFQLMYGKSMFENIFEARWVGLKHIIEFINSYNFVRTLRNTLLLFLYQLIFSFPLPIIFALLLNEIRATWFKRTVQTISYLPHFISTVALCSIVTLLLSPRSGLLNNLISSITGSESIYYLVEAQYFRTIYVASGVWQGLGWGAIIYLAAISTIDQSMYEAAYIDGATRWHNIWYITLPTILPTISILLIMNLGGVLNSGGEKVLLLYQPTTYETADVLSSYLYRRGLVDANYSFSTAVGLFVSLINAFFLVFTNWISGKVSGNSLF